VRAPDRTEDLRLLRTDDHLAQGLDPSTARGDVEITAI
jgi:hypothetical protein